MLSGLPGVQCLLLIACLAGLATGSPTVARAQDIDTDEGHITISDARLSEVPEGWQLDARAEIRLSPAMRAGLDSGVPLEFVVELALVELRRWWLDRTVFIFERRYTLRYYELTRHYRLQAQPAEMIQGDTAAQEEAPEKRRDGKRRDGTQRDGTQRDEVPIEAQTGSSSRNFRSLLAALDSLGTLRGILLPVPAPASAGSLERGSTAVERRGELSIRLDDRALPLPLQPVFSSTWKLASPEYVWPLN